MPKQRKIETATRQLSDLHLEIEKAVRGSTDHQLSDTRARAQELALTALSADNTTEELELAVKAVVLNPRCTDALVILADIFEGIDDYVEAMYLIVKRAAEDLGADLFEQERGHFWEVLETRPYMRARLQLALGLREAGMTNQAVAEFEGMLDLNANDNLGARFPLLSLYFESGKVEMASSLLVRFADENSAQFTWLRLLHAIVLNDNAGAENELLRARAKNKHVEQYLTRKKRLPEQLPETSSAGAITEAMVCAFEIQKAWGTYPDAFNWLKGREVPKEKKGKR